MIWLVILAVGAGSYAMRVVPLFLIGRLEPSPRVERALARAGTAALTALTVSSVVDAGAGGALAPTLLAVGVGGVAAARGASLLRVVLVGSAVFVAVSAVT